MLDDGVLSCSVLKAITLNYESTSRLDSPRPFQNRRGLWHTCYSDLEFGILGSGCQSVCLDLSDALVGLRSRDLLRRGQTEA